MSNKIEEWRIRALILINKDPAREIFIPFYARDMKDAEKDAEIIIKQLSAAIKDGDISPLQRHCSMVYYGDKVSLHGLQLTFQRNLDVIP